MRMKYLPILILLLLSGCFLARVDIEPERTSVTVITLWKHTVIDPDGYDSDPEKVKLIIHGIGILKGGE